MITLIKRIFIKDYKNVNDTNVRFRYGIVAGILGIVLNIILFLFKIIVGLLCNSITILADAINNLSDAGSAFVTIFAFKMSSKSADEEHPFGHARYEYLSALLVAILVFAIGVLLFKESFSKLIVFTETKVYSYTYVILTGSILVKFFQMMLYLNFAKTINSEALKITAVDSRNDIISTSSVLLATILISIFGDINFSIDGLFGILIALFIMINSIKLIKDTIDPLIGTKTDEELVKKMKNFIVCYDGILGVHDMMVHNYGENINFVTCHVEVPSNADIMETHDLIDNIEKDFKEEFNFILTIHMDPIEINNEFLNKVRNEVEISLNILNIKYQIHDFRMVTGPTHINILFDIVLDFEEKITKDKITENLKNSFSSKEIEYNFIIEIDRESLKI